MRYLSTRGGMPPLSFTGILLGGLAPDGGLVVPERIPTLDAATLRSWRGLPYAEVALPFAELPGYMRGNVPRAGETLSLMLVRTDDAVRRVPIPFLYDGHNIFGYMRATLR